MNTDKTKESGTDAPVSAPVKPHHDQQPRRVPRYPNRVVTTEWVAFEPVPGSTFDCVTSRWSTKPDKNNLGEPIKSPSRLLSGCTLMGVSTVRRHKIGIPASEISALVVWANCAGERVELLHLERKPHTALEGLLRFYADRNITPELLCRFRLANAPAKLETLISAMDALDAAQARAKTAAQATQLSDVPNQATAASNRIYLASAPAPEAPIQFERCQRWTTVETTAQFKPQPSWPQLGAVKHINVEQQLVLDRSGTPRKAVVSMTAYRKNQKPQTLVLVDADDSDPSFASALDLSPPDILARNLAALQPHALRPPPV